VTFFRRISTYAIELSEKPWSSYVVLALITLLAAALRFYKLGAWSFWIDEIFTINHARAHFSTPALILENIPPIRNWVPLSVILTAQTLNVLGVSEWNARLVSALIGIVSIPILYFPVRRMFGNQVAWIASLLMAVSTWHIFWSQNARFYTSLMLFYSLAGIVFYFALERNKLSYFFGFGILLYLAASERLTALFILPAIAVYVAALWIFRFEKPPGLTLRNLVFLSIPVFLGGLVEAYTWIVSGESRLFGDFTWFLQYRNDDPLRLLGNISFNIGVPLMVLALFSALLMIINKNRAGLWMAITAVLPLVMLVVANPFIFTKDRYVFMTLLSWLVLGAIGIRELFKQVNGASKWIAVGVLVLLLADAGSDALLYYRTNHGNRLDWQAAFNIIENRSQPDDIVVTYWPQLGSYYLDREFIQYEEIDVPTLLNSGHRYWFVVDAETAYANKDVKKLLDTHAKLIDVLYLRTPDDAYLRIYRLDPDPSTAQQ
jgi:4-amino-4-deoxy-L-arabinose transferase-like glycosyltransferase